MKERTISATITLPAVQLAVLLAFRAVDRHAGFVEKHGAACSKSQAARCMS